MLCSYIRKHWINYYLWQWICIISFLPSSQWSWLHLAETLHFHDYIELTSYGHSDSITEDIASYSMPTSTCKIWWRLYIIHSMFIIYETKTIRVCFYLVISFSCLFHKIYLRYRILNDSNAKSSHVRIGQAQPARERDKIKYCTRSNRWMK